MAAVAAQPQWPAPVVPAPGPALKSSDEWQKAEAERIVRLLVPRVKELQMIPNLRFKYQTPIVQLGFRVKRLKKRHLLLFNGLLIIARCLPGGRLNPRWLIALSNRKAVCAVEDSQYIIKNVEFRVYSPTRTFTFFARDPSERDAWIRMISHEVQDLQVVKG